MKPWLWAVSCFLKLDTEKKQNREKRCSTRAAGRFGCLNLHTLHREGASPCSYLAPDVQS